MNTDLDLLRVLASFLSILVAISIPVGINYASRRVERRRATFQVISTVTTDAVLVDRMAKIFVHSRDNQRAKDGDVEPSPYHNQSQLLYYDLLLVLNHFETICSEIDDGSIDRETCYRTISSTIVAVADGYLPLLDRDIQGDQAAAYPELLKVSREFKDMAKLRGDPMIAALPEEEPGAPEPS